MRELFVGLSEILPLLKDGTQCSKEALMLLCFWWPTLLHYRFGFPVDGGVCWREPSEEGFSLLVTASRDFWEGIAI